MVSLRTSQREKFTIFFLLGALVLFSLYIRQPTFVTDMMQNEDIAGITYNADLILRGKAPLVDNLEYKAPGPFFLVALVFALFGRSVEVLEGFGVFWSLLTLAGVFFGARALFGGMVSAISAALIFALYAPITDSMTVNYNSWMICPYVWASTFFIYAYRTGKLSFMLWAGISAALAALMKRQGAMIIPLMGLVLLLGHLLPLPRGFKGVKRWPGVFYFGLGGLIGVLPFFIFYLLHGGVTQFFGHYLGSPAGWEYVRGKEVNWDGKLDRLEDGILGLYEFLAFPAILAAMSIATVPLTRHRGWNFIGVFLAGYFLMSFIGVSLGFRFYKGYYLQIIPALAWIAAYSYGPISRFFRYPNWPSTWYLQLGRIAQFGLILLLCMPAMMGGLKLLKKERRNRVHSALYRKEARKIANVIKANTTRDEGIWVWGRWAWPIYFYSERMSSTRFYKVLGLITTNLTNTWKRPTSMTRFVKKGPWKEVGKDLKQTKPAFIVTANNESYRGFKDLEDVLKKEYRPLKKPRATAFKFYIRKERTLKGERLPKKRKPNPGHPMMRKEDLYRWLGIK